MAESSGKSGNNPGLVQFIRQGANFNFWSALAFVAFSLFLLISIPYQIEKPRLVLGRSLTGLDPALFPRVASLCMLVLSVGFLLQSRRLREHNGFRGVQISGYASVALTIIVLIIYAMLLEPIGFVASSAVAVAVLTFLYGNRNLILIALASLGIPTAIYILCTHYLLVYLPEFPFY